MRPTVFALAALLLGATLPHTQLEESFPAADAVLTESPARVTLTYSTVVQLNLSRVSVHRVGEVGQATQDGAEGSSQSSVVAAGSLAHPSEDEEQTLVLPLLETLESGLYRVEWRTAGPDGHPITDDFGFRVELPVEDGADEAAEAGAADESADPAAVAGAADAAVPGEGASMAEEGDGDDAANADDDVAGGNDAKVNGGTSGSTVQSAEPPASEVLSGQAIRFLFYAGILAVLGVVAFHSLILPRAGASGLEDAVSRDVQSSLWRIGLVGAALVVVSAPARLWLQVDTFFPGEAAANLGAVLGGTWGAGWWIQCVAAVLVVAGLAMARPPNVFSTGSSSSGDEDFLGVTASGGSADSSGSARSPNSAGSSDADGSARSVASAGSTSSSIGWRLATAGALLLPVAAILSGHGISDEPRQIAAAATYLHVGAASAWVGGLACLLFAGIPAAVRHPATAGTPPVILLVGAFSRVARIAVPILLLSGIAKAWLHLGAFSELWTTPWGFGLLVKGGWAAVVMLLGLYNWKVVQPALAADPTPKRLRRSTWWEFALGVVVVWVTAYLVAQPL